LRLTTKSAKEETQKAQSSQSICFFGNMFLWAFCVGFALFAASRVIALFT
jgi:hypothetical protein